MANYIDKFILEGIEKDIMSRLDNGEKVYIESGATVDIITSYEVVKYGSPSCELYEEGENIFTTTSSIFPKRIHLSDYNGIDTEIFKDKLFVHVW